MRLAALALAVISCDALACKFLPKSVAENFSAATAVFRARVTNITYVPVAPTPLRTEVQELHLEVLEVFKGKPPTKTTDRMADTDCSTSIRPGEWAVFFTDANGQISRMSGTFSSAGANAYDVLNEVRAVARARADAR